MRSMLIALLALTATPALAQDGPPAWAKGYVGDWTLESASEGGYPCGFKVLPQAGIGGVAVEMSPACRKNYAVEDVAVLTQGAKGELRFLDAVRKTVIAFPKAPDGGWVSPPQDSGMQLVISKGSAWTPQSRRELMSGTWSLSGPADARTCGFSMTSNKAGTAGTLSQDGQCPKPWKGKAWAKWTVKDAVMVVSDKAGAPILTLKKGDPVTYVGEDRGQPLFFGPGLVIGE
jgi:hypothetical protein